MASCSNISAFLLFILTSCIVSKWTDAFKPLMATPGRIPRQMYTMSTISPKTEKIFTSIASPAAQTLGAGGTSTLDGLKRLDAGWSALKNGSWKKTPMKIVEDKSENVCLFGSNKPEFDVVVCGGTLGVFYAAALQKMGKKVCIVERGKIAGRPQEWNISKKELNTLIRLGILDESEIKDITAIEFNPVRVGFKTDTTDPGNGYEVYVNDILNLGVKPDALIKLMRSKFIAMGGTVFEQTALSGVEVYQDCAVLSVAEEGGKSKAITAAVVMDSMGNASPISRQVRGAVEPDGICIVVGSCARGFDPKNNTYSDVIFTDTPLTDKNTSKLQYFWEAFPAGSDTADRTTYLFTYMDAKPERPSVAEIFDDYWELLPRYQGIDVDDLEFQRILYGVFPTYRSSPIQSPFHRILAVGDASGIQSPLSFGGFGSLTRHMERVCNGLDEALQLGMLSAEDLSLINPYQPNLSACWMFQRAMSVPIPRVKPPPDQVVGILTNSFSSMETLGDATMRPFLQDVLQFGPLLRTLLLAAKQDPFTPFKIVPHVGLTAMGDFFKHFAMLGVYTALSNYVAPLITPQLPAVATTGVHYRWKRLIEAWKFGSGLDYYDHE